MIAVDIAPLAQLRQLAHSMPDALTSAEIAQLNGLYLESLENLDSPESLFIYTLAKAMRKHMAAEGQSQEHIYLQRFEIPQIRLFELLIQQFPLANLSQHCTNTLLADALAQHTHPVLIDIGIGTGLQVGTIIGALAQRPQSQIRTLTVVGIEPFAEALGLAHSNIRQAADRVPFEVNLTTYEAFVEQLSLGDLQAMLPAQYDGLYVNASFALHHVREASQRRDVFRALKALQVNALVVSEPNSDHFEASYPKRFQNCVNHYGALFRIIDSLVVTVTEKAALKLFFSREIDDVLGNSEATRVEKHYATEQWVALFADTGYTLQKRKGVFGYETLNGTYLQTNLPDRYATVFGDEEITSLFWAE